MQSVLDAMEYKSFYCLMLTAAATTAREDNIINGGGSDRGSPRNHIADPRRQKCRLAKGSASGGESDDAGSIDTERDSDEDGRGGLRRTRK